MTRHFPYILIVSLLLFIPLFVCRQIGFLDFWWWMSANLVLLIAWAFLADLNFRQEILKDLSAGLMKKAVMGILSAARGSERWQIKWSGIWL